MWLMGMGKSGDVPKLNESMAIDLGANMLGEAAIVVMEYNRSSKKEEARERAQHKRLQDLEGRLHDLVVSGERRDAHIRHLERLVLANTGSRRFRRHASSEVHSSISSDSQQQATTPSSPSSVDVTSSDNNSKSPIQMAVGEATQRVAGK